jgi:hypothetical protein
MYVHEAVQILSLPIILRPLQNKILKWKTNNATCIKYWYDISKYPQYQIVLPPNDWQKMVGMTISVAIGCLDLDKRKGLMLLLTGKQK